METQNKFNEMGLSELSNVYAAVTASIVAVEGVYNKPRVDIDNKAGEWISEFMSHHLDKMLGEVVDTIKTRTPKTEDDYQAKCEVLMNYQTFCSHCPNEMLVTVKKLSSEALSENV